MSESETRIMSEIDWLDDYEPGNWLWDVGELMTFRLEMWSNPELDALMLRYHKADAAVGAEAKRQYDIPFDDRTIPRERSDAEGLSEKEIEWFNRHLASPSEVSSVWFRKTRPDLTKIYADLCVERRDALRAVRQYIRDHTSLIHIVESGGDE